MRLRPGPLPVKIKIFAPIFLGILIAVSGLTLLSIQMARIEIRKTFEQGLQLEVQTIVKMFERERALKLDKVRSSLAVVHDLFISETLHTSDRAAPETMEVENQFNHRKHQTLLKEWYLGKEPLLHSNAFVDRAKSLVGGTITVFQKIDSGYVRISTNVMDDEGHRAVGTFIPDSSPVIETIESGKTYYGRAYVVNDWYITAYEPVFVNGEIIGMLYVGDKEKDLEYLRNIINGLRVGHSGYVFVVDETKQLLMHPDCQDSLVSDTFFSQLAGQQRGLINNIIPDNLVERTVAFEYFKDFNLYVCATFDPGAESKPLIRGLLINAISIAVLTIILFSLISYFYTTRNVHRFLLQLENSNQALASARKALEKSEQQFRTLFNNSSDDIFVEDFEGNIIEVNEVACQSLGYTREELIGMHFRDLKSERYMADVQKNLDMIKHFGQHRYETENVAKSGKVIPVEMKSRVIEYNGKKHILSSARDITERKEIEGRILKAIISTEENERKRFAADLHDDLGPILSTVKLYTDLLKKKADKEETIANIDELVEMAIRTSREISNRIRPNVLQDFGLAAAISEFCSFINESGKIKITVKSDQYQVEKRDIIDSILFQAVKELVNNTIKHARAQNVTIDLKSYENQIILYYRDDGQGFDADKAMKNRSGLGLYNILNKVKTINGSCDLNSEEGKGMFMVISVKLKKDM